MVLSVQQVKFEFLSYIKEFDATFSNWCIGIADKPKQKLFEIHGVRDDQDPWLYKQLMSHRAARIVQDYFVGKLGAVGAPLSVKLDYDDCDCVYLYKIADHTRQE